ncbi:response regulator transcription factor [Streptomyces sp. NPDC052036]|uniref:helix-turn-helix transcriptional regulator n=1 Tax=unclassified Streptomyces TaxID=2593676 RepID=UPI003429A072
MSMAATPDDGRVVLSVTADDQLTREGAVAALSHSAQVHVAQTESTCEVDVCVVLATEVTDEVLGHIARESERCTDAPVVLVANSISEPGLLKAVGLGVVAFLSRGEATFDDIVEVAKAAQDGHAAVPPPLLGPIIRHFRQLEDRSDPDLGLSVRDLTVLNLLAEGLDTAQIALRLRYSERTIKNIIHGVVSTLGVANRTQAVAHAIRAGIL